MPTQQQIEKFTLAFHRAAVKRLREQPQLLAVGLKTLDRWESNDLDQRSQRYRKAWREMLIEGVDSVERKTCQESDEATALRSTSPLSSVLSEQERIQLRMSVVGA
jgi:hypothetical protein